MPICNWINRKNHSSDQYIIVIMSVIMSIALFLYGYIGGSLYKASDCEEISVFFENSKTEKGGRTLDTYSIIDINEKQYYIDGPSYEVFDVFSFENDIHKGDMINLLVQKGASSQYGRKVLQVSLHGHIYLSLENANMSLTRKKQGFYLIAFMVFAIGIVFFLTKRKGKNLFR